MLAKEIQIGLARGIPWLESQFNFGGIGEEIEGGEALEPVRKKRRVAEEEQSSSCSIPVTMSGVTGMESMSVAPRLSRAVQKLERWALHQQRFITFRSDYCIPISPWVPCRIDSLAAELYLR